MWHVERDAYTSAGGHGTRGQIGTLTVSCLDRQPALSRGACLRDAHCSRAGRLLRSTTKRIASSQVVFRSEIDSRYVTFLSTTDVVKAIEPRRLHEDAEYKMTSHVRYRSNGLDRGIFNIVFPHCGQYIADRNGQAQMLVRVRAAWSLSPTSFVGH